MPRTIMTISIDPILAIKLEAAAKVEGIPMSRLVERALARELGLTELIEGKVQKVKISDRKGGKNDEREQSGSGS